MKIYCHTQNIVNAIVIGIEIAINIHFVLYWHLHLQLQSLVQPFWPLPQAFPPHRLKLSISLVQKDILKYGASKRAAAVLDRHFHGFFLFAVDGVLHKK